jgi:hypothetical protein
MLRKRFAGTLITSSLLIALNSTDSLAQDIAPAPTKEKRFELSVGIGPAITTSPRIKVGSTSISFGDKPLISPDLTVHIGTRFSSAATVGLRLEATTWRSKESGNYTDINANPIETKLVYTIGRPALTVAPYLRLNLGKGNDHALLGFFAGYVQTLGKGETTGGPGGNQNYYIKGGSGFTGGIEAGYTKKVTPNLSLNAIATLQYVSVKSQGASSSISFLAIPVTFGVSRTF